MRFKTYLLAVLLLVACGKQEAANKTSSTNSVQVTSSQISGQVFVVTQGKENIKLALVEISAIPEIDILQYLNAKHSNGLEQQKVLMPELESAKKAADAASVVSAKATKELDQADSRSTAAAGTDNFQSAMDDWQEATKKSNKLSDIADSKTSAYRKIKSKSDNFDRPEYYFEKFPTPIGISKTDADGKFTLSLPPGKYAIAATSSRKVFKDTESYYWLVWVDTSSPNQSLMLSNDNLFETKCKECVQP